MFPYQGLDLPRDQADLAGAELGGSRQRWLWCNEAAQLIEPWAGIRGPRWTTFHSRAAHQAQCEREQKGLRGNTCVWPVPNSCPTLLRPMDYRPPGPSVHGISRARTLEWVAMPSSRGSTRPRDWTCFSCTGRQVLYHWTSREAQ